MQGKKTGGRVKGTPNKTTAVTKEIFARLMRMYGEMDENGDSLIEQDFRALPPEKRMASIVQMAQYVLPKQQAVTLSGDEEKPLTIEDRLVALAKEQQK